jgi:uncharacterized membrane protein HdeD (DUF308 family)
MKNELPWWLILIEGISAIILGFFFLRSPAQTTFWVTQFLGIWWFIGGIFDIVGIFMDKSRWGWKLFSGILGIIAGILIIGHPAWSTLIVPATLVIILGIEGIIIGIVYLIRAFQGPEPPFATLPVGLRKVKSKTRLSRMMWRQKKILS